MFMSFTDGIQIDVIPYEMLSISLCQFKFFRLTVSLVFAATKLFHLLISERTKHKTSHT